VTVTGWLQIVVVVLVLTTLTPVVGGYMARVYQDERVRLTPLVAPIERWLCGICGLIRRSSRVGRRTPDQSCCLARRAG
jgi:K+-transporting ATPase A subunit